MQSYNKIPKQPNVSEKITLQTGSKFPPTTDRHVLLFYLYKLLSPLEILRSKHFEHTFKVL